MTFFISGYYTKSEAMHRVIKVEASQPDVLLVNSAAGSPSQIISVPTLTNTASSEVSSSGMQAIALDTSSGNAALPVSLPNLMVSVCKLRVFISR